ncbi:MAG: SDR family oxidoreductase [Deltaproteobacteria bacterium]|nr:SDR family oxidoreductase [Deltaproteobacteria bacterium]
MFAPTLFKNRTILITGGGTGLGLAMGKALAQYGAHLILVSRNAEHLEHAAAALRTSKAEVVTLPCDIRDHTQVATMLDTAFATCGTIDGLINNAAGNIAAPTESLSPNAFLSVVGTVLHGSYFCTQQLGRRWIAAGARGTVLSIVTTYAWSGSAFVVPSACAKAGVLAMTRSLAVEWGRHGIRLNAIAPGPFPTAGAWQRLMPPGLEQAMVARNPLGRVGRPEELAHLALFLLSDAADYINGECITIDGGEWLAGAGQFNALSRLTREEWEALRAQAAGNNYGQ